ncbi:3-hydroxyacyl-CoA dehydrogenase NAD-binding domain-containing protein [Streptomyces sp. NBC_01410]|uniref:3-hydroxyacyl-CoA dehydrogenase family protein n=1 Tax=Streptomyces sp. NBC_01410 TaxID=2903856 RepID=UPI00324EDF8F
MTSELVQHIGVIGAGTMGVGVSHLFAQAGFPVTLTDISNAALDVARKKIARNAMTYRMLRPEQTAGPEEILSRIHLTTDVNALQNSDFVVENATEDWGIKEEIYREIDGICPSHCIFGVNTSAISITRVAALTLRPGQVVGTHFMNPAPLKRVVEVIRGFHTSEETLKGTRDLLSRAGNEGIVVNDSAGFVTNRVMMLTVNEAVCLLEEGVATAPEIDRLFKDCFGHTMGPLETCDLIGLDTVLYSLDVLYDSFNDPKYRPSQLLKKMVYAGQHGQKSGSGFYSYC